MADPVVIGQMQEMAISSINGGIKEFLIVYIDGYTKIVYNFIKNGG